MEGDAARLMELFRTDAKHRDAFWRDRLNAAFWPARLGSFKPHVMQNDRTGFFCYRVGRDERDGGQPAQEPAGLVDWVLGEGYGFVLWPSGEPQPIWEFTLGDVLSYRLYGTAFAPRFWDAPADGGRDVPVRSESVKIGSPNEAMFPTTVRHAVRRMMQEKLGIREPKVLLFMAEGQASRLVFDLPPEAFGGEDGADLAYAKVAWCVPSCIPLYRIDRLSGHEAMRPF